MPCDGVVDDFNDWTWSAEGDGWHGTGTGLDPDGLYTTEGWADATGWLER